MNRYLKFTISLFLLEGALVTLGAAQFRPKTLSAEEQAGVDRLPLGLPENPVRAEGPEGQRAYLNRLMCSQSGPPVEFRRHGSVGKGPYGTVMDVYEVSCPGMEPVGIFMDMYHTGFVETRAVPGFTVLAPGSRGFYMGSNLTLFCDEIEQQQSPIQISSVKSARVHGSVFDPWEGGERKGADVPLIFVSENYCAATMTGSPGESAAREYEIALPPGTYRLVASKRNYCNLVRAEFRVNKGDDILINLSNFISKGVIESSYDPAAKVIRRSQKGIGCPLKGELLPLRDRAGRERVGHIYYASNSTVNNRIEYHGKVIDIDNFRAVLTLDTLAVIADLIIIDTDTMLLEGQGHVVVEDGVERRYGDGVTVDLGAEQPVGTIRLSGTQ